MTSEVLDQSPPKDGSAAGAGGATGAVAVGACLAVLKLLLHFAFNSDYGYFRDELYFLACGEHLAWGYPDHAPLVALMAKVSRDLLGGSLFAIRFFPALAGAAKVFLTALLVKEFGGGRFAALLACLCVLCAPVYLGIDNLLSMNALEPVFWMLCVYAAVLAVKRDEPRLWLWFGLFAGLGLMNKHSMLFFGASLVAGLLLTPARRALLSKWFWLGGAVALLVFLPNIVWQFRNDFATLELLRNVQKTGKNVVLSPPAFVAQQVMMMLPATVFVWGAGLWYFLGNRVGRRFLFLGVAYLALFGLMLLLKAKDYYLAPVYPMLFAAGGVWWEGLVGRLKALRFMKVALPALIFALGALVAPVALPVLPVETLLRYQAATGLRPPKSEVGHEGPLHQLYGDQFGWEEMVEKVAAVYHSLPPEERARAAVFANNYGEAGAVDFFGARHGLPKAVSRHQSYYLWGPREYTGEVLIVLGDRRESAGKVCRSVEEREEVNHPLSMREEKYKILICRGTKEPLPALWPKLRLWN